MNAQTKPMRLDFIVGGGRFLSFDYRIVGGPDHGRRVELMPWRPEWALDGAAECYNGPRAEYEALYGFAARPHVSPHYDAETLHPSTVAWLMDLMRQEEIEWRAYDAEYQARKHAQNCANACAL